jgi:hypothetical protein
MTSFDEKHRTMLEGLLEPGETLEGICAASQQQSMFKGRAVAIAVTGRTWPPRSPTRWR